MNTKPIFGYRINEDALKFYRDRPGVTAEDLVEKVQVFETPAAAVAALESEQREQLNQATADYITALQASGNLAELKRISDAVNHSQASLAFEQGRNIHVMTPEESAEVERPAIPEEARP